MKKRLLFVAVLLVGVLALTGCNKEPKEKITIKDKKLKYTTTFEYKKEDGFEFKKNIKGGRFSEIEFTNEKENLKFDMYYSESSSKTAKTVQENRSKNKYYKEYTFGEYKAYTYGNYADSVNLIIKLKDDTKEDTTIELFTTIDTINYDNKIVVADKLKEDVILNFFKSIKNTVE